MITFQLLVLELNDYNGSFFKLKEDGFSWDQNTDFISNKTFTTFKVGWSKSEVLLKLDFVNDSTVHFCEIIKTDLFCRIDSVRNILSNKLSAVFRYAAKNVADIREIALQETVDWGQIIREACEKEAGIELIYISEILTGMPQSEFETIAWVKKPQWDEFRDDINRIVFDMMKATAPY